MADRNSGSWPTSGRVTHQSLNPLLPGPRPNGSAMDLSSCPPSHLATVFSLANKLTAELRDEVAALERQVADLPAVVVREFEAAVRRGTTEDDAEDVIARWHRTARALRDLYGHFASCDVRGLAGGQAADGAPAPAPADA